MSIYDVNMWQVFFIFKFIWFPDCLKNYAKTLDKHYATLQYRIKKYALMGIQTPGARAYKTYYGRNKQ